VRLAREVDRHHVIEVIVNQGEHAYAITCASKSADVVQDVCAPAIGGLRIAQQGKQLRDS
jgi:hypothetical protein